MAKAFVHINGVDYELAGTFAEHQVVEIARLLATGSGMQKIEVTLDGGRAALHVNRARLWSSGAGLIEPARSACDDRDLILA